MVLWGRGETLHCSDSLLTRVNNVLQAVISCPIHVNVLYHFRVYHDIVIFALNKFLFGTRVALMNALGTPLCSRALKRL